MIKFIVKLWNILPESESAPKIQLGSEIAVLARRKQQYHKGLIIRIINTPLKY